ncbi:hypothetical protein HKI87_12g70000 [Chloropicon roscoffensis]|uniref:Nucleolus and neural progenitor protein-like N-terminal domain-containing protein n=1 Tax=Chloropicon roscoffensis TaxID=1461544 RepID=A0AAX4PHB3_9CHLO
MSGGPSSLASLASCRDVLRRLLRKNESQHRRGRYFRELAMVSRGLAAYLGREAALGTASSALVSTAQLERIGGMVAKAASTLTSLLARTHFMPFSLVSLTLLARIRILVAHDLAESVRRYNAGGEVASRPDFLSLDWDGGPSPTVRCHYSDAGARQATRPASEVEEEEDLRGAQDELCVVDDKGEEPPARMKKRVEEKKSKKRRDREREARSSQPEPPEPPDPSLPSLAPEPPEEKEEASAVAFVAVAKPKRRAPSSWRVPPAKVGGLTSALSEIDDIFSQLSSKRKKKRKK